MDAAVTEATAGPRRARTEFAMRSRNDADAAEGPPWSTTITGQGDFLLLDNVFCASRRAPRVEAASRRFFRRAKAAGRRFYCSACVID